MKVSVSSSIRLFSEILCYGLALAAEVNYIISHKTFTSCLTLTQFYANCLYFLDVDYDF